MLLVIGDGDDVKSPQARLMRMHARSDAASMNALHATPRWRALSEKFEKIALNHDKKSKTIDFDPELLRKHVESGRNSHKEALQKAIETVSVIKIGEISY